MTSACMRYREDLTAFVDSELGIIARLRLRAHIAGCPRCATDVAALEANVHRQREVLATPVVVDVDGMLAAARGAVEALGASSVTVARRDRPILFPWNRTMIAGAAVAAAALLVVSVLGVTERAPKVLIPLGLEAPPAAVAKKPDLFREYDMIRELDALEHFDVVNRVRIENKKPKATRPRQT